MAPKYKNKRVQLVKGSLQLGYLVIQGFGTPILCTFQTLGNLQTW